MKLTPQSTAGEVILYHPKMVEYENKILDPNYRPGIPGGHWDAYNAQERVVMRRHLRQFFPAFCNIVDISKLDHEQLVATINRIKHDWKENA